MAADVGFVPPAAPLEPDDYNHDPTGYRSHGGSNGVHTKVRTIPTVVAGSSSADTLLTPVFVSVVTSSALRPLLKGSGPLRQAQESLRPAGQSSTGPRAEKPSRSSFNDSRPLPRALDTRSRVRCEHSGRELAAMARAGRTGCVFGDEAADGLGPGQEHPLEDRVARNWTLVAGRLGRPGVRDGGDRGRSGARPASRTAHARGQAVRAS